MEAEAPEAVGSGICFIGFFQVLLVVSLYGINHSDADLGNQMVNGVQSATVGLPEFRK